MTRAFLGLGSNVGDRAGRLREAIALLGTLVTRVSPTYETEPVGGPDQSAYLNLVVEVDTDLTPRQLLGLCHRLETAAERVRTVRWGPRTLDVDILWVEGVEVHEPDLEIPHPRLYRRRFVLAPLRDLAPDLVSAEQVEAAEGRVERWPPPAAEVER